MGSFGTEFSLTVVKMPVTVVPAEPTERHIIYLTNIDLQVFFHVETLLFYSAPPDTAFSEIVDVLKNALSKVLVPFHFVAGRFEFNEKERLELNCNEAGVLFADAKTDIRISELGEITAQSNPSFKKLILYPQDIQSVSDVPPLTVQVTGFGCGGFSIGLYNSHCLMDGISGAQFFSHYAAFARGCPIEVIPSTDRTSMMPRQPPFPLYGHEELINLPATPAKLFLKHLYADCFSAQNEHTHRIFTFSAKMLGDLKKKAQHGQLLKACTTFEALAAHLWQAKTKAMGMPSQQRSKLFIVVDIRNKLKPALPENFMGNGVVAASCVNVEAKDIMDQPLSFCVNKVQKSLASVNEEYVRSQIDWCELNNGHIDLVGGMLITAWTRLPFGELDFGWGKPIHAVPVINSRSEFVVVLPGDEPGGLRTLVSLKPPQMANFEYHIMHN